VVLDVGCGTGIAARQFRAAGCLVLGVDVDPRMAAVAREQGFDVEVARFEEWDAAGRTFDAVVAGQTWHWIEPVAGAAKAAAVLRPGGRLALFWNVFQPPAALAEAFGAVYRRVLPELFAAGPAAAGPAVAGPAAAGPAVANVAAAGPAAANLADPLAAYRAMVVSATDGMAQAGGFGPAEQWWSEWDRTYSRAEWLDQIPTHGGVNRLPQGALSDLLAGVGAAIDAAGGSVPVRYTTVAVTAVRES
jgi:SAM-dependent methyltransferase